MLPSNVNQAKRPQFLVPVVRRLCSSELPCFRAAFSSSPISQVTRSWWFGQNLSTPWLHDSSTFCYPDVLEFVGNWWFGWVVWDLNPLVLEDTWEQKPLHVTTKSPIRLQTTRWREAVAACRGQDNAAAQRRRSLKLQGPTGKLGRLRELDLQEPV